MRNREHFLAFGNRSGDSFPELEFNYIGHIMEVTSCPIQGENMLSCPER